MRRLRKLAPVLAAGAALVATAVPAVAAPHVPTPGGLRPNQVVTTGDCYLTGVVCKPSGHTTSCTGYTSQSTPPASIRVLINNGGQPYISTVPFETYVENVLPDEWISSWDGDALKAGAVAVKSYAWYWVLHYGGSLSGKGCFDVADDTSFQVYRAGSAQTRTTTAVQQSWPVAARVGGRILQASYRAYLHSSTEACGSYANGSTLSQWGTQNCNEASSGNKYNVILDKYYSGVQLATARQLNTQHDFQFLQTSTKATFNAGHWSVDDGYPTSLSFGQSGDIPTVVTAGDGFARIGVYRPSTHAWYVGSPTGAIASKITFGVTGDIPVQAQYAGLTVPTVLAVYRPSTQYWYQASSTGSVTSKTRWGISGDIPVPGHYTSSTTDQLAIFRPSDGTWHIRGADPVQWGQRGDIPIPADYDGNGTTDYAIYRPSTHRFYVRGQASVEFGLNGDIPVTGDFNGDGHADLAVYRPSTHTWYVRGIATTVFGSSGATAIGVAPYHD